MLFREPVLQQLGRSNRVWAAVEELFNHWCSEGSVIAENVSNIWLEMDYELGRQDIIEPCVFFDASKVRPLQDNSWIYGTLLSILLGASRAAQLQERLDFCIDALAGRNRQLFQLGVMLGRRTDGMGLVDYDKRGLLFTRRLV